jgi:DNA polymerase-3 subunit chi
MVEVNFYHLQKTPLEKSLPRLLEKVYSVGKKAVVLLETEERLRDLDTQLWTYAAQSFLPHGSVRDGFAELQPIWLTTSIENPNGASVLVVVEGEEITDFSNFEKCLDLFNGYDEEAVKRARIRWKKYKQQGYILTYWFQDEKGNWEKRENGKETL